MPRFTSKNGKLPYPRIVFYVVKVLQIISACAVAGVMFFFIAHLNSKKSSVPWMFYILHGSALATLVSNFLMGLWIRFRYWIPKVSAIVNGILTAAWGAGFGLLVNAMHETILVPCTKAQWGNDRGILVCTLYKALLAAGGFGVITTFTMMVLDIVAARKMKSRRVSTVVSQSFMSKSVDTEYEPIWSGQMGRPTGFSPPVHEENPRFEPMRGEGPSY